jgi:hypothetical protein
LTRPLCRRAAVTKISGRLKDVDFVGHALDDFPIFAEAFQKYDLIAAALLPANLEYGYERFGVLRIESNLAERGVSPSARVLAPESGPERFQGPNLLRRTIGEIAVAVVTELLESVLRCQHDRCSVSKIDYSRSLGT